MIYLDSSVVLAQAFAEDRVPPAELWSQTLVASRLMTYEVWNRVYSKKAFHANADVVRQIIDRVALLEMSPAVLDRALEPFPLPVRTLDGLHLASMDFLLRRAQAISLATYDERLRKAAEAMEIPIYPV
jgi:predicted nucleic acid-binding protein